MAARRAAGAAVFPVELDQPTAAVPPLVESYRRLAEVFHHVLSEEHLDNLLGRIADTLAELVPYDALHVYEADDAARELVPTLARTCLQDAMPTTLSLLFGGHAGLIRRRAQELRHSLEALHLVALGGTVIGSGEGAPVRYRERVVPLLAARAGVELRPHPSPCDLLQNSDDVGLVSAQLALLAHGLAKIARDLRLLGSGPRGGLGEFVLPHVQEGSSFFTDKSNPVVPETLLQACFQVLGCDRAVQAVLEQAELYLNVFDGLAALNVLDALAWLSNAVSRFDEGCMRGLVANEARCRELAAFGRTS